MDDDALNVDCSISDERDIHAIVAQPLDDFVAQSLLQSQRHQRKGLTEVANGAGHQRIKQSGRCNADAELALLAPGRAMGCFQSTFKVGEHRAGLDEQHAASVG